MPRYSYYPGCTLHSTAAEYDQSARAVCRSLGIELVEIPGWACCGATSAHAVDELLAYALPAHTLTKATEPSVLAPCAACYSRLRYTENKLARDAAFRARVETALGAPYRTGVAVRHLLDVIAHDVPVEEIRARMTSSLGGVRCVCYYGCLLTRPPEIAAFDDVEEPRAMDNLMATAGATVVDWPHRTRCCGAAFSLSRTDIVYEMTGKLLRAAVAVNADVIAVVCPMCQSNLDLRQPAIRKKLRLPKPIPAVYFTQLLGLALGIPAKDLGFAKIMVDTKTLLSKIAAGHAPAPRS